MNTCVLVSKIKVPLDMYRAGDDHEDFPVSCHRGVLINARLLLAL